MSNWGTELIEASRKTLSEELDLSMEAIKSLKNIEKLQDMIILPMTSINTASAIAFLSQKNQNYFSEMVILSRGFFEKLVNSIYLIVIGDSARKEIVEHSHFRSMWHIAENEKIIGKRGEEIAVFKMGIKDKNLFMKDLKKKGYEKYIKRNKQGNIISKKTTDFPVPPINERLSTIESNSKVNIKLLLMYQLLNFDTASEGIHGSLFGSYHPLLYGNIKYSNNVEEHINKQSTNLLISTSCLLHELIVTINELTDIQAISRKSKGIIKKQTQQWEQKLRIDGDKISTLSTE